MNRFSRIRHHVDMKDVRRKHLEEAAAKKYRKQKQKKREDYIRKFIVNGNQIGEMTLKKNNSNRYFRKNSNDWSQELDDMWKSDWRDKLEEGMTTSDTFSYSVTGKGDVDLSITGTGYTIDGNSSTSKH